MVAGSDRKLAASVIPPTQPSQSHFLQLYSHRNIIQFILLRQSTVHYLLALAGESVDTTVDLKHCGSLRQVLRLLSNLGITYKMPRNKRIDRPSNSYYDPFSHLLAQELNHKSDVVLTLPGGLHLSLVVVNE